MLHHINTVGSTNAYAATRADSLPSGDIIFADEQTAGRGQRGNSWEAEPGKNITMSIILKALPVAASQQFAVSEVVALAVADALSERLPEERRSLVAVKWPNDIYVADKKIAGILIECALGGAEILYAIAGIGLNVNQTLFVSDAPNPTSILLEGGDSIADLPALAREIGQRITAMLTSPFNPAAIHRRYLSRLWRREGTYPWRDRLTDTTLLAAIHTVAPDGILTLRPADGSPLRPFAFKELEALL